MIMGVDVVINGFVDASLKRIRAFLLASGFDRLRPEEIAADFLPNLQLGFLAQVLESDFHKRVRLRFNVAASIDLTRRWAKKPPDALVCPGGALPSAKWRSGKNDLDQTKVAARMGRRGRGRNEKRKTALSSGFILAGLGLKTLPPWKRKET
jgi:hypothetical protein